MKIVKRVSYCLALSLLCINVSEAHVSIGVNFGGPAYVAPSPVYYGPPPGSYYDPNPEAYDEPVYTGPVTDVEWVPRHIENGYWVPGHYVRYTTEAPGADYVWVNGNWGYHHRWHRGYGHHY